MAELDDLLDQRCVIVSVLERFERFLNDPQRNGRIFEIETRLSRVEAYINEFEILQSRIEKLQPDEKARRGEIEDQFYSVIATAKQMLREARGAVSRNPVNLFPPNSQQNNDPLFSIKLPQIKLPTFDGELVNWLSFHDTYVSLIHSNNNLTSVNKLQYLKSALQGSAKAMIESLETTADNYDIAWSILFTNFHNNRLIISSHIKRLFELPIMKHESYKDLRDLTDNMNKHLRALEASGQPVESWNMLIIHLITQRFPDVTKRKWEATLKKDTLPTLAQFREFLNERCVFLNSIEQQQIKDDSRTSYNYNKAYRNNNNAIPKRVSFPNVETNGPASGQVTCYYCKGNHLVWKCETFSRLSLAQKHDEIKKLRLCINCLKPGHSKYNCRAGSCRECQERHNTILHPRSSLQFDSIANNSMHAQVSQVTAVNEQQSNDVPTHENLSYSIINNKLALLSTAIIYILDRHGEKHQCRVLLDSGSQSNFMTDNLCNKLQLKRESFNLAISGINQNTVNVRHKCQALLKSRVNDFGTKLTFHILPRITSTIPSVSFLLDELNIPHDIKLADPSFNKADEIDLLLGVEIFYDLLREGQIKLGKGKPILQETFFGWIISGSMTFAENKTSKTNCHLSLNQSLAKFWELEEIVEKKQFSHDEQFCENYFRETTFRDDMGRFVVKLPFKESIHDLGNSYPIAYNRLKSIERRFARDVQLKQSYSNFMQEYLDLRHMSINPNDTVPIYQLPHHAVRRESSTTTKRVVFDGTAKPENGFSLNECIHVGPTIQDDLFSILSRFRSYQFVLTADIKQMYRQILIHPDDRKFQTILWRFNDSDPLENYTLNTVTYGTASAPFLAIRSLQEIAHQNLELFPQTCRVILRDFYVDDLLTGTNSKKQALQLKQEISTLLLSYGMELRKWSSNDIQIRENLAFNELSKVDSKSYSDNTSIKTLGLTWNAQSDTIHFPIHINMKHLINKRQILSIISQIFDPLGLVGPVTIKAKLLLQTLWQLQINWDDNIPTALQEGWLKFLENLTSLTLLSIPRNVLCDNFTTIELHAFCDASESAYGCCIYLRSKTLNSNDYYIRLLCAKSRVAPLKRITLPQLELLGALLLSKLVHKLKNTLTISIDKFYYWSDSTIVLSWINIQPCYLKTFVANRVSQINDLTSKSDWYHVRGSDNPADIISRGLSPESLNDCTMWWQGPDFLRNDIQYVSFYLPSSKLNVPEVKRVTFSMATTTMDFLILERYSSLPRLLRVTANCFRFVTNCRRAKLQIYREPLSVEELDRALLSLIKLHQLQHFSRDISCLKDNKELPRSSQLIGLNPFLDHNQILRVGGRIQKSDASFEQKHPIILATKGKLTELIIRDYHLKNLHAGTQTILAMIRLKYWPLSGMRAIKRVLRRCITCFRVKPKPCNQLMGNLPGERVHIQRPFYVCGVDYAGPFPLRDRSTRNYVKTRGYVCLFICLATKAIHLELVSQLTTECFFNALKRFIARRGKPASLYSDNGTNFVGASNQLNDLYNFLSAQSQSNDIVNFLSSDRISWRFIPAYSPHMGGIWESAIKLAKTHLTKVISSVILTFEEFYSILVQIEGCLNSRPIIPISTDPSDSMPLTPAHFLVGESLAAIPEYDIQHIPEGRLNQYQKLQQLFQRFWSRWSTEYLSNLQVRSKWKLKKENAIQPGDVVILVENNIPPLKWPFAKIVATHPGPDGLVRVVTVQLPHGGCVKRAIAKVCLLPNQHDFCAKNDQGSD